MWLFSLEINLLIFPGPECYYICVHLCHNNSILSCCELPLVYAGVWGKFVWSRTLENKKVSDKVGLIIVQQTNTMQHARPGSKGISQWLMRGKNSMEFHALRKWQIDTNGSSPRVISCPVFTKISLQQPCISASQLNFSTHCRNIKIL